jgi:hypothetical protein
MIFDSRSRADTRADKEWKGSPSPKVSDVKLEIREKKAEAITPDNWLRPAIHGIGQHLASIGLTSGRAPYPSMDDLLSSIASMGGGRLKTDERTGQS